MWKKLFLLFFLFSFGAKGQDLLETLRKDYRKVSKDSSSCAKLYEKVKSTDRNDPLFSAYKGAVTAAMAEHTKNKESKIKLFTSGKKLLESAIASDTSSAEMRFLRFTIQTSCPKILGYNKQIESDKTFVINNLSKIKNEVVKENIRGFMGSSTSLTAKEKEALKK